MAEAADPLDRNSRSERETERNKEHSVGERETLIKTVIEEEAEGKHRCSVRFGQDVGREKKFASFVLRVNGVY